MATTSEISLRQAFARQLWKLRVYRALRTGVLGLTAGGLLALVLVVVCWFIQIRPAILESALGLWFGLPAGLGAFLGFVWPVRERLVFHQIDRSHGFDDLLLSAFELIESERDGENRAPAVREAILQRAVVACEKIRFLVAYPPQVIRRIYPAALALVCCFFAQNLPARIGPAGTLHAIRGMHLNTDVSVPELAALQSPDDKEAIEDLEQTLDTLQELNGVATPEQRQLEVAVRGLVKELKEGRVTRPDALARLKHLQARMAQESKKQELSDKDLQKAAKKFEKAARKMLEEHGEKISKEEKPSAVFKALSRLAEKLAEKNPDALARLAEKLAKSLTDKQLAELARKHKGLEKKLSDAMSKKRSGAAERRLKRLQERLKKKLAGLKKDMKKRAGKQSPGLEKLRRNLESNKKKAAQKPPQKSNTDGANAQKGQKGEKQAGKKSDQAGKSSKSGVRESLRQLSQESQRREAKKKMNSSMEKVNRRLRRSMERERIERRLGRRGGAGKRGPERLGRKQGPKGSSSSGKSAAGPKGSKPGSSHEKDSMGSRTKLNGKTQDHRLGTDGKAGTFNEKTRRGAKVLGEGKNGKVVAPRNIEDELLNARIPERYREGVRHYFELMSEPTP